MQYFVSVMQILKGKLNLTSESCNSGNIPNIYYPPNPNSSPSHSFPPATKLSDRYNLKRDSIILHLLINLQRRIPPTSSIKEKRIRPRLHTLARHRPRRNATRELVQTKPRNLIRIPERDRLLLRMAVRHGRELRARRPVILKGVVGEEVESRGAQGVLVGGVEEHEGIAGEVGVGVFVEVDAVVGGKASVLGDEVED